jgi:hypothetical protein
MRIGSPISRSMPGVAGGTVIEHLWIEKKTSGLRVNPQAGVKPSSASREESATPIVGPI